MTFDEYQKKALVTAIKHPDPQMNKTIYAMGVSGEAGELLEKWKKIVAYKDGVISDDDLVEIKKEIGDVMWYLAVLADSLGLSMQDVVDLNIEKLASRKQRDVLKGAGDNR